MQVAFSFPNKLKRVLGLWPLVAVFTICPEPARPDFWSLKDHRPETVKLVRKLPPVAARNGSTVRFITELPGATVPQETATILRDKIRTLLMDTRAGSIQLVDGPADTMIKCIITGYEPKIVNRGQRQVGMQHQQIVTWIGNIEASVQVLDSQDKPIDAANIKHHLENDFLVAQSEEHVAAVTDKKSSWRDKLAGGVKVIKGGDKGDVAALAGGGKQMHDALAVEDKGGRPPTDLEWRNALIEGLAAKVANRIVPVDQEFVAVLPLDKEFAQIREMAKSDRWGDVQESTEKMGQLQGARESFRLYTLGLSYEAMAYREAGRPGEAAELLNKGSKYYDDARKLEPREREFLLAQIRVQDSLDHYLEIQHYLKKAPITAAPTRPAEKAQPTTQTAQNGQQRADADRENTANNAALIEMMRANMPEAVLVTFVQTAADPKFDVSANGLLQLARASVPAKVIEAVQKRMAPPAPAAAAPKRAPTPPSKK
jgi:hypothetical protein